MLRGLRDWVERTFAAKPPPTREQSQQAAEQVRHDRAGAIDELRSEVRRLQQGIKDVSDSLGSDITGDQRTAQEARLASLQRDLEQKQRELSRIQGRV